MAPTFCKIFKSKTSDSIYLYISILWYYREEDRLKTRLKPNIAYIWEHQTKWTQTKKQEMVVLATISNQKTLQYWQGLSVMCD